MFGVIESLLLALSALSVWVGAESEPYTAEESTGEELIYTEYLPGNINLIISIPHDGYLKPENIKDRRNGLRVSGELCDFNADIGRARLSDICKVVVGADLKTTLIGKAVAQEFKSLTAGQVPHLIIAKVHRSKVDLNRRLEEASQGDLQGEVVFTEYHNILNRVKGQLKGPGLLIDLHGQNHKQNSTELGYLYTAEELNLSNYSRSSSIRSLMERRTISPESILSGSNSLGDMFEVEGYRAVPSPRQKKPGKEKYYRGGYITEHYGSSESGQIDAIQIEVPSEIRVEGGEEYRTKFSSALARILNKFFSMYYTEPESIKK